MTLRNRWLAAFFGLWAGSLALAADMEPAYLREARQLTLAAQQDSRWMGPTRGPAAQPAKRVWFIGADLTNGGVAGVFRGFQEACRRLGWQLRLLDGKGSDTERQKLLRLSLQEAPDALVLGGFNSTELPAGFEAAASGKTVLVGWHAAERPGPDGRLFSNVSTDPLEAAQIAASFAVVQSGGRARAVLLTDSHFAIATAKTQRMREVLARCTECSVLAVEDVPLAGVEQAMPALFQRLQANHGERWNVTLGINDLYFSAMSPLQLRSDLALDNIAAGDGSAEAMKRIRAGRFQVGSVAEPLRQQGWQLADEINRALAGSPHSAYVSRPHLLTRSNVRDSDREFGYDPDNGYREAYQRIWFPGEPAGSR